MLIELSNLSQELFLLFFLLLYLCLFVLIGVGIYFYKKRETITKKYDIDYFLSFLFGTYTLMPAIVGVGALLFAPKEEGLIGFLASLVYFFIAITIYLCVSKNKPHRIKRMFVMMIFTMSLLGFLISKVVASFWESAMRSGSSSSTEAMLRENIEKANRYYDRKESEDYYRYMKGKY